MNETWFKLDNTAKIFPSNFSFLWANGFRVSCVFKENIDKGSLLEAVNESLVRFPSLCVKRKRGFFWYYFEHNFNNIEIYEENSEICKDLNPRKNNEFLFRVSYFGKRLNLEMLHELTDANGAVEFLKTIIYYYCLKVGYKVSDENGLIRTKDIDIVNGEFLDDFNENYKNIKLEKVKEPKAFQVVEKRYSNRWSGVYNLELKVDEVKEKAHQYNTSITGYLGAVLLFSLYNIYFKNQKQKYNGVLFIPVNIRRFFDSLSLRNFIATIRTEEDIRNKDLKFEDCIQILQETLTNKLTKENLTKEIIKHVKIEKNFIIKILPLFIKDIAMFIAYYFGGKFATTVSFSNIGLIKMDDSFNKYLNRFEFINTAAKSAPNTFTCCSFNNRLVLTNSTIYRDRKWLKEIVAILKSHNLEIIIDNNDTEVL